MATTPYPFVASTVLTALQLNSTFNIPTTTLTASHTLTAANAGTRVYMNSASATTITVNTSIFSASDIVEIINIGAGVCTITAGTCTVSTTGTLALVQNAGGRLVFTSASVSVFQATGVAGGGGKLGQCVSTFKSNTFDTSSATYVDITGLSVAITPVAATSKILVIANLNIGSIGGDPITVINLVRDSTSIGMGDTAGSRTRGATGCRLDSAAGSLSLGINFLDSPATTSSTTYKLQMQNSNGIASVNRTSSDTNSATFFRSASSITVMEILA